MSKSETKILVCFYKDVLTFPTDPIYFNIQCGKSATNIELNMQGDNTGDNISERNTYWSEITGLYWAWKNMSPVKYIGLCSYRRFFNFKRNPYSVMKITPIDNTFEIENICIPNMDPIFLNHDVVIPKPYSYAYNIRKVCDMNYRSEDFDLLEKLVHEFSPEYDEAYRTMLYKRNKMIGHNMFIMKWENFEKYCSWMFPILLEMERRVDPSNYPVTQIRVFGYMHEILLGVYIEKQKMKKYYSQVTWLAKDSKGFKFNNLFYKIAAEIYYNLTTAMSLMSTKFLITGIFLIHIFY